MGLRRELLLTISTLVVLNLLLSFGSIGLFGRIGPAVERILRENVESIFAAETILAELAAAPGEPITEEGGQRIHKALTRTQRNVTEAAERPLLNALERALPGAVRAEPGARAQAVDLVLQLIEVNREAMREADRTAQRLGVAGAWAAVSVGFLSFLLSLVIVARFRRRLLEPLIELHQVLDAVRRGYHLRRCRPANAPLEVRKVAEAVNELLDERLENRGLRSPTVHDLHELALKELLERQPTAAALIDREGRIERANDALLELLSSPDGDRVRGVLARRTADPPELTRIVLGERGWLVLFSHAYPLSGD